MSPPMKILKSEVEERVKRKSKDLSSDSSGSSGGGRGGGNSDCSCGCIQRWGEETSRDSRILWSQYFTVFVGIESSWRAHKIKGRTSSTAQAVFNLRSERKWCLTGTPLQNRSVSCMPWIRFLRMDPFAYYFCKVKGCNCRSCSGILKAAETLYEGGIIIHPCLTFVFQ